MKSLNWPFLAWRNPLDMTIDCYDRCVTTLQFTASQHMLPLRYYHILLTYINNSLIWYILYLRRPALRVYWVRQGVKSWAGTCPGVGGPRSALEKENKTWNKMDETKKPSILYAVLLMRPYTRTKHRRYKSIIWKKEDLQNWRGSCLGQRKMVIISEIIEET